MQDLEKYSSTVQQLALGGWHGVNGPEEFLMEEGEEVGDDRAEGSSATGDGGQAAVSLTPNVTGHANARLHFRKFATWFIYRGLSTL